MKEEADFRKVHRESFDLMNTATNSKLKFKEAEGGLGDVCMAIDEMKTDERIVGYIEGVRKKVHLWTKQ